MDSTPPRRSARQNHSSLVSATALSKPSTTASPTSASKKKPQRKVLVESVPVEESLPEVTSPVKSRKRAPPALVSPSRKSPRLSNPSAPTSTSPAEVKRKKSKKPKATPSPANRGSKRRAPTTTKQSSMSDSREPAAKRSRKRSSSLKESAEPLPASAPNVELPDDDDDEHEDHHDKQEADEDDDQYEDQDDEEEHGNDDNDEHEPQQQQNPVDAAMDAGMSLHALLQRLGAHSIPRPSANQAEKIQTLLRALQAIGDDETQFSGLVEVSEMLSMGTEETLGGFRPEEFVPPLVDLLNHEHQPETMLLACRALTNMMEALPGSSGVIAQHHGIESLCNKLLTIEYIDLAEQSLTALEKMSVEYSGQLLKAGGLSGVLTYIDFFNTSLQRSAILTASNICKAVTVDDLPTIRDAIPLLTNLLQYSDDKVVERTCLSFARLVDSFRAAPNALETVASYGLLNHMLRLIQSNAFMNNTGTFTMVLRTLSVLCHGCPKLASELIQQGVIGTIRTILVGDREHFVSGNHSAEQLYEIVSMCNELFPTLSDKGEHQVPTKVMEVLTKTTPMTTDFTHADQDARLSMLQDGAPIFNNLCTLLLPLFVELYQSSVSSPVRRRCLSAILKMIHLASAELLKELLKELAISSFLAGLLSHQDELIVVMAMHIAEVLISKLPEIFHVYFRREGVVDAMEKLSGTRAPPTPNVGAIAVDPFDAAAAAAAEATASATAASATAASATLATSTAKGAWVPPNFGSNASAVTGSRSPAGSPATMSAAHKKRLQDKLFHTPPRDRRLSDTYESKEEAGASDKHRSRRLRDKLSKSGLTAAPTPASAPPGVDAALALNFGDFEKKKSVSPSATPPAAAGTEDPVAPAADPLNSLEGFQKRLAMLNNKRMFGVESIDLASAWEAANKAREQSSNSTSSNSNDNIGTANTHARRAAQLQQLERTLQNRLNHAQATPAGVAPGILASDARPYAEWIGQRATIFCKQHVFSTGASKVMADLRQVAETLRTAASAKEPDVEAETTALKRLCDVMADAELNVSSFELHNSGLIAALLFFLVEANPAQASRLRTFCQTVLHRPATPEELSKELASGEPTVLSQLVQRLHGSINLMEKFPVLVSDATGGGEGSSSRARGPEPIRLKIVRDEGADQESVTEFNNAPVLIEPLATIQAIEEFLLSRVCVTKEINRSQLQARGSKSSLEASLANLGSEAASSPPPPPAKTTPVASAEAADSPTLDKDESNEDLFGHDDDDDDDDEDEEDAVDDEEVVTSNAVPSRRPGGARGHRQRYDSGPVEDLLLDEPKPRSRSTGGARSALGTPTPQSPAPPATSSTAPATATATASSKQASRAPSTSSTRTGAASPEKASRKLAILLNGHVLPRSMPIAHAIQRFNEPVVNVAVESEGRQFIRSRPFGSEGIKITYREWRPETDDAVEAADDPTAPVDVNAPALPLLVDDNVVPRSLAANLTARLPVPEHFDATDLNLVHDVLALLHAVHGLNRKWDALFGNKHTQSQVVPEIEFINAKLTAKVTRQLEDAVALYRGAMPPWIDFLCHTCPFLFSFEARQLYFASISFGSQRMAKRLIDRGAAVARNLDDRQSRLSRTKVRVSRDRILESATKLMESHAAGRTLLEVEFIDEAGSGLGPTLEFYTLVCQEFCKVEHNLWRTSASHTGGKLVYNLQGLFPAPVAVSASGPEINKLVQRFQTLGSLVGRALLDSRILDLPFNPVFLRCLLGEADKFSVHDLALVDEGLGRQMQSMAAVAAQYRKVRADSTLSEEDRAIALANVLLYDSHVEDLMLDFTLPGYPEIELKAGGAQISLTLENLEEYVQLVVDYTLRAGIGRQINAFHKGFSVVLPTKGLGIFAPEELDILVCGCRTEKWDVKMLSDCCKADHGYTSNSRALIWLYEVLSEFDAEEQRSFLTFATGSPRLPVGGLSALKPPLTVVRKTVDTNVEDTSLPSIMTCHNYLKLPDYSSKQVLKDKLLFAMNEGQGSFHLS